MFQAEPICGYCCAIGYGPQHNLGLHQVPTEAIKRVVDRRLRALVLSYRSLAQHNRSLKSVVISHLDPKRYPFLVEPVHDFDASTRLAVA